MLEREHEHTVEDISWAVCSDLPWLLRFSQRTEWFTQHANLIMGVRYQISWRHIPEALILKLLQWRADKILFPAKKKDIAPLQCLAIPGWHSSWTWTLRGCSSHSLQCSFATAHLWKLSCHGPNGPNGPNPRPSVVVDAILLLAVDASGGWESFKAWL